MLARINLRVRNSAPTGHHRRTARIVLLLAACSAILTGTAVAASKKAPARSPSSPPLTIGRGHNDNNVNARLLVDSHGTVNAVWLGVDGTHYVTKYARKSRKARGFTQVALPNARGKASIDNPVIFQPSAGVLEIFVGDFGQGFAAWRSTNDGASWRSMDTTALNGLDANQNILLGSAEMIDAPGGPIDDAGDDGASGSKIVQLKSDLRGVTQVATDNTGFSSPEMARALDGSTYLLGAAGSANALTYQAKGASGTVTFPCSTGYGLEVNSNVGSQTLAAGRSVAVVAYAGCGHVWTRTITPGGVLGPLTTIGVSPKPAANGANPVGQPWVAVTADSRGEFTAAWVVPGGDLASAHSANGSKWTLAPGFVPTNGWVTPDSAVLSGGAPGWYATDGKTWALADVYKQPPAPPATGIADPSKAQRMGSLAAVVPRRLPLKSFRASGETTISVVDATAGPVSVSFGDSRTSKGEGLIVCQGGLAKPIKLAAGKPRTLKLSCTAGGGAITIGGGGGTYSKAVDAHKGDTVTFSITDRQQTVSVKSHVG